MYLHKHLSNSKLHSQYTDPATLFSALSSVWCTFLQGLCLWEGSSLPSSYNAPSITRRHHLTAQGHHTHSITWRLTWSSKLWTVKLPWLVGTDVFFIRNFTDNECWDYLNRDILLLCPKVIRDIVNRISQKETQEEEMGTLNLHITLSLMQGWFTY